jgi:hypothetical protein
MRRMASERTHGPTARFGARGRVKRKRHASTMKGHAHIAMQHRSLESYLTHGEALHAEMSRRLATFDRMNL